MNRKILIINEPNYKEITEYMTNKACEAVRAAGFEPIIMNAPDIIEFPTILRYYLKAAELRTLEDRIVGYIALGCNEFGANASSLMKESIIIKELESLKLQYSLALGYGIFSPKDAVHAKEWSVSVTNNAVERCLQLLEIKKKLGL